MEFSRQPQYIMASNAVCKVQHSTHTHTLFAAALSQYPCISPYIGSNNVIKVHDADTLQLVNQLTGHQYAEGRISCLGYSGRNLWSASTDGTIRSVLLSQLYIVHAVAIFKRGFRCAKFFAPSTRKAILGSMKMNQLSI